MSAEKKLFKNTLIGKILSPIRFGAVEIIKGVVPGGSSLVKVVEHFTEKNLATGEKIDQPTNWGAIVVRLSGLAILLFLVMKNLVPVDQLLEILKGLF